MADDVRNDQIRSISATGSDQTITRNKKRQTKTRTSRDKKEAKSPEKAKSFVTSSPEEPTSIKDKTRSRSKQKSKEALETSPIPSSTKRNKRKASKTTWDSEVPGPSGINNRQKSTEDLAETTLTILTQEKTKTEAAPTSLKNKGTRKPTKKATPESDRKVAPSLSEGNVTTSPKKSVLKKTRSDTSTTNSTKQGQKRKAKKYPVFSPKKLRSSSNPPTTINSQSGEKSAKTGPRLSRTVNPPEVNEPSGGTSSSKLGSCASRRRNRRTRTQRDNPAMENERNGNSSTQESSATNEDGQESNTVGPLAGAVASLTASGTASSSGNAETDLAASLEEGDMTRLQALLEARGLPAHLFGSLGPRMHLLLHKTFNSGAGAKAQQLLTSMQSEDEGTQLQGVMEMCQLLVMGNEETLGGFPVKQVVPVLITLLQMEHNFDIMNHACRALTYLMEGLPRSSVVVIDAVPMLLEKLQTIQCMDVAEQSLTALEMLSKRHGKNILQAGGLGASLLFLDFFSIVAQRSALAITANCCHSVTVEDFQYVRNSIQILSGRLLNQDKKSLESVCLAFARLVDNVQKDKKLLEELCEHNLLANLKQLLIISPPLTSSGTFVMVIRMLGIMCANCPTIAVQLLKLNITETLRYILIGSNNVPTDEIVELVPRSPQELYELITLICELLPNLPNTGIFSIDSYLRKGNSQNNQMGTWQWKDDRSTWHTYMWVDNRIIEAAYQAGEDEISLSTLGRNYTIDFTNMQQINEDTGTIRSIQRKTGNGSFSAPPKKANEKAEDERSIIFEEEKEIGKEIVQSLIAVVFDVYYSSVGPYVKHKCLNSVLKMLYHSPSDLLKEVLSKIPISSYIAGMLSSQDVRIVCSALQKADILMSKLSDTFHVYFRREGVMHRVKRLADGDLSSPTKSSPPLIPNKNNPSEDTKHAQAVGSSSKKASDSKQFDDITSMQESSNEVPSSTSKLASLRNRKKGIKKFTRSKGSTKSNEGSPPSSSLRTKRLSHDPMRPKSSTFSGASQSASTGNVASKASFFASFAPRWGRSQSVQSTVVSGSTEKSLKDNIGKEQEQNREKIRTWIRKTAQDFYTKYFTEHSGNSHPALNILLKLTAAAEQLALNGDADREALESIRDVLLKEDFQDGASPFEMVHSGMVTRLLNYLTSKAGGNEVSRTVRVKNFLTIFLGFSNINDSTSSSHIQVSSKPALVSLVQKLNLCINQLEQFPVKCQDIPGSGVAGGSRGSSALRFFNTHQIKCNLQRHPDCSNVKQWSGGAVKIDPLALVQAIERYLVVRGYGRVREDIDSEMSDDDDRSDDEIEECWASQLQISNNPKHILEFTMNDHVIPYNMTVYQAVRQYAKANHDDDGELDDDSGPFGRASIWSGTHTIYFRPMSQSNENLQSSGSTSKRSKSESNQTSSSPSTSKIVSHKHTAATDISSQTESPFLADVLPGGFASSDPSVTVICLLRVLYYLNSNWRKFFDLQASQPVVSFMEFVNTKLTAKATRQLQDPLVIMTGNLPSWLAELAKACPFIFPFECRQLLFYTTTFDRDRAVMKLQESVPDLASTESSDRVAPRLDKKKRTVSRADLFKQAENCFNEFTNSRSLLEIQYEGEVGTGLGPTLEFYSLVSKEFQRADLEMWRGDCVEVVDGEGDSKKNMKYAFSRDGLFPAVVHKSIKSGQLSKLKSKFRYLGKFLAKACMDSRMIDINFSETFYKWLVTPDYKFDICDMQYVDKTVYKSLSQLYDVVLQKKRIENDITHTKDSLDLALSVLTLDGVPIEDLGLDFVLPGTNYELKKNGKDIAVAIDNLEEYLQLVVQFTLIDGVLAQIQAFKEGFEQFFSLSSLQMFYPHEIDILLCGSKSSKWDTKDLMDCCRADHGYTIDSRAVKFLFEILSKYDPEEQRSFLQFITGSPNLPVGGFKSLNPPLTIVRKTVDNMSSPDFYLPSVMTCVNYLKLPDYSTVDVMDEKLRTAYLEGKNAFHLS